MRSLYLLSFFLLCVTASSAQRTIGLQIHEKSAEDGYVLFAPMFSKNTFLIDKCGLEVHRWMSGAGPANSVYLLPNGNLLRTGETNRPGFPNGGLIELLDWNSNVLWQYVSTGQSSQHHDVCMLPNGNVLALVWQVKTREEAIAAGRDSVLLGGGDLYSEKVVELRPDGLNGATVVWEWDVWDHLVQDRYPAANNYGGISGHPELLDLNFNGAPPANHDWIHTNGIAYNAELDQIMISVYWMSEFWIIDHGTTTAEAKLHSGGRRGKGGDFLYRWGNPQAYGRGTAGDQKLFRLHNAHWISSDKPDSGKIVLFNNGQGRPTGNYSSVIIVSPTMDASGDYIIGNRGAGAFEPQTADWEYTNPVPEEFYSAFLAGADRLHNGNMLMCEATKGAFIEVDPGGTIVWKYVNPVNGPSAPASQGDTLTGNLVFRCEEYLPSYPGLAGRTLTPGRPIERNSPANYECFPVPALQVAGPTRVNGAIHAANPFGSRIDLVLDGSSGPAAISLINMTGSVCGRWELGAGNSASLEVPSALAPGMYMLRIDRGGTQTTLKLRHN